MEELSRCNFAGCKGLAAASLETRPLCREHFLTTCRARLEACTQLLQDRPFRETDAKLVWQFISECAKAATDLIHRTNDLDPREQGKLLEILFWVEATSRRMRRSARKIVSIPVLLRCDQPGCSWEEESETQALSRHGASLNCQHPVEVGEILCLVREDTGREARARVVSCKRKNNWQHEISVEFMGCDNFWELDWSIVEVGV